ncbi:16S rRNA (guanine1207-N2)-methyltransferase [Salinibacillus kushneri]|uniref:16S rRNA (Guanine1207-N2)-methyltransferase n=1 Tax=Salinibacillus kushneri TaxID=237682 RepID=A0A1I0IVN7_9BACI|nr:class I SAM-dependent methyltransferase [Salinibacillus kushneri]SEU00669.1 16S rRNA (guanine1207-N2)-methyltransferase [Salinibacillus kushneri]
MSEHYYSKEPSSKSNPATWSFTLRNKTLTFTSDIGVFSKNEVDFGSRVLIETFDEPEIEGDFLDVGCGYGPIGLSLAASFQDRHIFMIDINKRAVDLAVQNANQNNISNVTILSSDLFEKVNQQQFAAIITNPPIRAGKKVVHSILQNSFHYLREGGALWVVIQKKQGAPSAKKKLEEIFQQVSIVKKEKGYYILKAVRFD